MHQVGVAVCSEIHTQHCKYSIEFLNVKSGDT